MTNEMIQKLEAKGFNRWQKGNMDRLYINPETMGLEYDTYKTGNVAYCKLNGEKIANRRASKYICAKTYIDVETAEVHSTVEEFEEIAKELLKEVEEEITEEDEEAEEIEETEEFESVEEKALKNGFDLLTDEELAQYVDEIPDWSSLENVDCHGCTFIDELSYRAQLSTDGYRDTPVGFDFEQLIEDALQKLCGRGIVK